MKKIIIIAVLLFLTACTALADNEKIYESSSVIFDVSETADSSIILKLNGEVMATDVAPVIVQSRTLVPARAIFERLGATVEWKPDTRQTTITMNDTVIVLEIDKIWATVNGKRKLLDVPASIIGDRTMLPVRFVVENLGMDVSWIPEQSTVSITYDPDIKYPPSAVNQTQVAILPDTSVVNSFPSSANISQSGSSSTVKISDIGYQVHDGIFKLILSAPVKKYSDFTMTDHDRIIVDIESAVLDQSSTAIMSGELTTVYDHVYKVRWSQYKDDVVRIVLDLSSMTYYRMATTSDAFYINVFAPGSDSMLSDYSDVIPALSEQGKKKIVVLDPGHGGKDGGANYTDAKGKVVIMEKTVNLDIALKTYNILKQAGASVYMTRSTDVLVDLYEIPKIANKLNASLFVSIHNNSLDNPDVDGTMVFYYSGQRADKDGINSKRTAELLQKELLARLGTTNRNVRPNTSYVVLKNTTMPAVLAEIAFISNAADRARLLTEEFREKAAIDLSVGIIKALNGD